MLFASSHTAGSILLHLHSVSLPEGSPHQKKQRGSATLQLLQAHGITMLPADETTLVASAVENGQTVVLTGTCYVFYKGRSHSKVS